MGEIYTTVGQAVESANAQARELSRKHKGLIMAVVTRDTGPKRLFLSWATPEQVMAANETECGWYKGGVKLSR